MMTANVLVTIYYHSTTLDKIELDDTPIWLSHSIEQAAGWESLVPGSRTFMVVARQDLRVAYHRDEAVRQILGDRLPAYVSNLRSCASPEYVRQAPETRDLLASGYAAFCHPDYDPTDQRRDHDVTLLFDRSDILDFRTVEVQPWSSSYPRFLFRL